MAMTAAEIRRVATGPTPETAALTLAVTFTYSEAAVDCFKALVQPWQYRWWDGKAWYVHPSFLGILQDFARAFDHALWIDGERWENLKTGKVMVQGSLPF